MSTWKVQGGSFLTDMRGKGVASMLKVRAEVSVSGHRRRY